MPPAIIGKVRKSCTAAALAEDYDIETERPAVHRFVGRLLTLPGMVQ